MAAALVRALADVGAVEPAACGCRGRRSIERILSVMSSWEPSTLEPTVAKLQEDSKNRDVRMKMAEMQRKAIESRPSLPTLTMRLRHSDYWCSPSVVDKLSGPPVREGILSD